MSLASQLSKICAPPLSLSHFINASLHICGAPHSTMDSILASHPASQGSIPGIPKIFSELLMLPRLINSAAP